MTNPRDAQEPRRNGGGWTVALFALPVLCCAGPAVLAALGSGSVGALGAGSVGALVGGVAGSVVLAVVGLTVLCVAVAGFARRRTRR